MESLRRGRRFLGLVGPRTRQHTTGGKPRLGSTSKMGQRDLRRLLVTGTTAVGRARELGAAKAPDPWLAGMLARKAQKVVAVALANRTARKGSPCRRRRPNTKKTPATPRPLQTDGWLQPSGRGRSFRFRPVIRDALSLALLHHIPYKAGSYVVLCQNFSSVHTTSNTASQGWVAWRRFLGRETPSRPPRRRAASWGGEHVRRYDLAGDSIPVGCRRRRECRNCGPCGNSDQGHQGGYGKPWSESHVGASCPGWCEPLLFVQCRLSTP